MTYRVFSKAAVRVVLAGTALVAANSAFAAQMNSIADSWHNLGANNIKTETPSGNPNANKTQATGEICVFCHTPHGGDNSAAVPIWNRVLNTPTNYTRYSENNTTTFDAHEEPIGSVSIACLSCHDGAQAIDALINAPGSGNYTPQANWTYDGAALKAWNGGVRITGGDIGTDGKLDPNVVQNLGLDLSNDHPISMQYAGGGITGSGGVITNNTPKDKDFTVGARTITKADTTTYQVVLNAESHASLDTVFWIERGGESLDPAGRDRSDVIFYTRNVSATTNGTPTGPQPFVECGSCHDPHNVDNPTFLRVSNGIPSDTTDPNSLANQFPNAVNDAASGLCLTCHDK